MYLEIQDGPNLKDEIQQVAQIAIEEHLEKHPEATENECQDAAYKAIYQKWPPRDNSKIGEVSVAIYNFENNKEWE